MNNQVTTFEAFVDRAQKAPALEGWVATQLQEASVETILDYCRRMFRCGGARGQLARRIAQSAPVRERVVSTRVRQEDGTYQKQDLPDGHIFRPQYREILRSLK